MNARSLRLIAAASLLVLASCADDTVRPPLPVTFSGTVAVRNDAVIPTNARILVLWGVASGVQDYSYVWGEGTLAVDKTFTITFDEEPPEAALNIGEVGVGLVILTTDQDLHEDQLLTEAAPGMIGMAQDYSIIFTKNLSAELQTEWPGRFNGYGLGQVERNQSGLDTFKSVARDALELIVDDLINLHPPNWG